MKKLSLLVTVIALLACVFNYTFAENLSVPNSFTAGTVIESAKINANYTAIYAAYSKATENMVYAADYNSGALNSTTLNAAKTAIGNAPYKVLYVKSGTWTISTATDFSGTNTTLYIAKGATISVSTGVTFTGKIIAEPDQKVFTGTGTVNITNPTVFFDWYSPVAGDSTDDGWALKQAFNNDTTEILIMRPGAYDNDTQILNLGDSFSHIYGNNATITFSKEQDDTPVASEDEILASSLLQIDGIDDLTIQDLNLVYDGTYDFSNQSYAGRVEGMLIQNVDNLTLDNISATGFNAAGVHLCALYAYSAGVTDYCENVVIKNSKFSTNRVAGLLYGNTENLVLDGNFATLNGKETDKGTGYGFAASTIALPKNTIVVNNHTKGNWRKGIDFHAGYNATISNNIMEDDRFYCLYIDHTEDMGNWIITGNQCSLPTNDATALAALGITGQSSYGFAMGSYSGQTGTTESSEFIVSNNTIKGLNQANGGTVYGMQLYDAGLDVGTFKITNNTIEGNVISRFITGSTTATSPGFYTDIFIDDNWFFAETVETAAGAGSLAITLPGTLHRFLSVSNNTFYVLDYNTSYLYSAGISTIPNYMQRTNNNIFSIVNTSTWNYDPFRHYYSGAEESIGNIGNNDRYRDWDGKRYISWDTAAPVAGYWRAGSVVYNTSPSAGNVDSWLCTVTGTPGTWVGNGIIRLVGSATWDPADMADGDEEAKEITVTSAALGDYALCSFSLDVADLALTCSVTAANTVTASLLNNTGGNIDLASGTVRAKVIKQ